MMQGPDESSIRREEGAVPDPAVSPLQSGIQFLRRPAGMPTVSVPSGGG